MSSLASLASLIAQTFDANTQASATNQLQEHSRHPGFTKLLLDFIGNWNSEKIEVVQSASILFKNNIRKFWPEDHPAVSEGDRVYIKDHVVRLMLSVPELIRLQLSDAILAIADHDYPAKWPTLRDELVSAFTSSSVSTITAALSTFEAIFKKYSILCANDELFTEMLHVLEPYSVFCTPFLTLFKSILSAFVSNPKEPSIQNPLLYCLDIIHHLITPDLPAFFEDNFKSQDVHTNIIHMLRTILTSPDDLPLSDRSSSPSMNTKMKQRVAEILTILGSKQESFFEPYLDTFLSDIFGLLSSLSDAPRFDGLAISGTLFLDAIARSTSKSKFNSEGVIRAVFESVISPLLTYRNEDLELIEDDPRQFMLTDLETGVIGEVATRRGAATELVRALTCNFSATVLAVSQSIISSLITSSDWSKLVSGYLMILAMGIKSESPSKGATELTVGIDLVSFFQNNVVKFLKSDGIPDLLITTSIRFLISIRLLIEPTQLISMIPILIGFLNHKSFVVHTYAAWALDKIFNSTNISAQVFNSNEQVSFILTALFNCFNFNFSELNEFVMKTIVTVVQKIDPKFLMSFASQGVNNLLKYLESVVKNPTNPAFNYWLFECIAAFISSLTSIDLSLLSSFESALFTPLSIVLSRDLSDLEPFVFQIFALLLEKGSGPWSNNYVEILKNRLLNVIYWENRGNVPSLSRLLSAYIKRGREEIGNLNLVEPILGPWQKLIQSKMNDVYGFNILNNLFQYLDLKFLAQYLKPIFGHLLTRYTKSQTVNFRRCFYESVSIFCIKFGPKILFEIFESLQVGLAVGFLTKFWIPECGTSWSGLIISKSKKPKQLVGIGCISVLQSELVKNNSELFLGILTVLMKLAVNDASSTATVDPTMLGLTVEEEVVYSPQHSNLICAKIAEPDFYQLPVVGVELGKFLSEVARQVPALGITLKQHHELYTQVYQFVVGSGGSLNI
ncbi:hypothetical protein RCL1_008914 [Eukaryota sp. TZLM3-RCL]